MYQKEIKETTITNSAHMLIGTNTDMTYKEIRYGLGDISAETINLSMTKIRYVNTVKYFGKDVDYDLLFKNDCLFGSAPRPQKAGVWAISNQPNFRKSPCLLKRGGF